jgi:Spy/CpxP family protein refolding chaperone
VVGGGLDRWFPHDVGENAMRIFCKMTLVLAVSALLVAADDPADRMIPDDTTIQLILLRQKSVQEDLKLTAEMGQKIREFTDNEYEAWQKALKLPDEEREQKVKELQSKNESFLADNLTEDQRKRLKQIMLQITGLMQLTRPEIVKALDITEEQQEKFKALQKESGKELQEILEAKNDAGKNEKLAKLREDINKKVGDILTDQQKEKAKEYVGAPFKGEILLEGPSSN